MTKLINILTEIATDAAWDKVYSNTEKFPNLDRKLFDSLNDLYPHDGSVFDKGYFNWLYRMVSSNKLKEEDFYKVKEYLALFDANKKMLDVENRDINKFKSVPDLYNAIKHFEGASSEELMTPSGLEKKIKKEEVDKVYEDGEWLVMIPHTERASCLIGKGTKWCTAADKANNMFDSYNNKGNLYVIVNKSSNEKYQLHYESHDIMDASDRPVNKFYFFGEDYSDADTSALTKFFANDCEDSEKFAEFMLSGDDDEDVYYSELLMNDLLPGAISGKYKVQSNTTIDFLARMRLSDDSYIKVAGYTYETDETQFSEYDVEEVLDDSNLEEEEKKAIIDHLMEIGVEGGEKFERYASAKKELNKHGIEVGDKVMLPNGDSITVNSIITDEDSPDYNTDKVLGVTYRKGDKWQGGTTGNISIQRLLDFKSNPTLF